MTDDKLLVDEARRSVQHGQLKGQIQRDVKAEIAAEAERPDPGDAAETARVGAELRERAIADVAHTEREVQRSRRTARVSQIVDYLFAIVYSLLAIRLALALVAARPGAAFVQWIRAVTDPLLAPFRGILPNLTSDEGYTLALPVLFAILIYGVAHLLVKGLLRLIAVRRTSV